MMHKRWVVRTVSVALASGAFFCALATASAEPVPVCKAPSDLTRLDRPLAHTALRLLAREPVKIVAIGSSSTAGAGASAPANAYPSQLEIALKKKFPGEDITVVNRGVNGEITSDMLARFDRDVLAEKPDLVLWQVGSNVVLRDQSVETSAEQMREGVKRLKDAGIDVVLVNIQYSPAMNSHREAQAMVDLIDATAKEANIGVFHRYTVMKYWRDGENLPFGIFVTADGVHMNDWGYRCWARLMADALAEAATRPTASANALPLHAASPPGR